MPAQELSHRFQKAVLWEANGIDSYGQPTVAAPVEITVRWVANKRLVTDGEGNKVMVEGTLMVAQDIPVKSAMWLGELADWYGSGSSNNSGEPEADVMEVITFTKTADLKARNYAREVTLAYYKTRKPNLTA